MSAKPRDLGMTPLDDLFSTDESRAEAQLEKVVTLNPADISDFPNHPFKVKQDEAMAEMVDSVKQYGVLVPALVRPKADGGYEMVAGHRRKCAATLAGITEMPCMKNARIIAVLVLLTLSLSGCANAGRSEVSAPSSQETVIAKSEQSTVHPLAVCKTFCCFVNCNFL